jgi:hypothetical protein
MLLQLSDRTWLGIDALGGRFDLSPLEVITAAVTILAANESLLEDFLWDQPIGLAELEPAPAPDNLGDATADESHAIHTQEYHPC